MGDVKDLAQRIEQAGARIEPRLSDGDLERLMVAARQRGRRRTAARAGLSIGVLAAAMIALVVARRGPGPQVPGGLRFNDGSVATPVDPGSLLVIAEDSPQRTRVELKRGGARFEVTPHRPRMFSVSIGAVTVTVVGTVFVVDRQADRVGVTVERGTVKVGWTNGEHTLRAGEDAWFPLDASDADAQRAGAGSPPSSSPSPGSERRPAPPPPADARGGGDVVGRLLAAADAARAAGHADEGAALLRRVLDEHAGDPRAPLARFTLGRVLLMDLGRPLQAAQMFADLRARAPDGPFAADALAREVEAWSRAGRREEARARAEEYLRLYPDGNRKDAVRSFGGIP
ncbi:MAG TPA: FecR domain-containing protein [Polyangia bacterium]|nr:FecR domain-containing protein [Polyangia bacterium]